MNFTLEINLGKETLDVLKQLLNKTPAAVPAKKEKLPPLESGPTPTEQAEDLKKLKAVPEEKLTATDTKMTEAEVRAIVGPINKDADMDTKRKIKEEYLGGLALPEFVRVRSAEEVAAFVEQVKALKK